MFRRYLLLSAPTFLLAATALGAPIITDVVETGGDNEATDTITAKWTGQMFTVSVNNEPVPGLVVGNSYTVGFFGNHAPAFVDRNHRYTNASATVLIPGYIDGAEYIMSGNDNRDNNPAYTLDVSVSEAVTAFLLVDNRLGDPNSSNADPPSFGPTKMQWVIDGNWIPVITGANRAGSLSVPDEIAIDESADGTLNQWYSVYARTFPAGMFQLRQADNAGQNMYGAAVAAGTSIPGVLTNVVAPGDVITLVDGVNDGDADAGPPPGAEGVEHSIDRVSQKYLNFLDLGSGFVVTPQAGSSSVTGIRIYTANDEPARDPSSYLLEGATDPVNGPWTVISSNSLSLPLGRNTDGGAAINPETQFRQAVYFANTNFYTSYRVTFPTLRDAATANSMQIAEVELLGVIAPPTGTGSAYADAVLADGPIAYWRFNDVVPVATNSGTLGAAADGTYNGDANAGAQAPLPPAFPGFEASNTALQLDGAGDFVGSVAGLMNSRPVFTISGWIRRETDQANRTGLFGQNDLVEFGYIDNNTIQAWTDNGLNVTPNPFPNGEWAHLALVSEGSPGTLRMYTNGIFAASRNHTLPTDNSFPFNIGGGGVFDNITANGNYYNGQIDEVAIFDKALSAEQISAHYFSTIPSPPIILAGPQSTNVFEGGDVILSVSVAGPGPFTYQWYDFGNPIPGETSSTLVFSNIMVSQGSIYSVCVANAYGEVCTPDADVTVSTTQPPTITQEPASAARYAGASLTLNVVATGGSQLDYQWQKGGADVSGANNASLAFASVQASDAGDYRVIVSNSAGSITSAVATVTIITPAAGSYEELIVQAGPIAFWRFNETSGSTAFDNVGGNDATYVNPNGTPDVPPTGPEAPRSPQFPGFEADNLAAQFDGSSVHVAGPVGFLNGVSSFTMVGWIRRGGDQANRTGLFGQNDIVEFGYINNDTLELWTDNGLDVTPNPIPNETWAQVAVVSEGSPGIARMYANGAEIGMRSHSLPPANQFAFNIGGGGVFDGMGNYFLGQIDDLAVFNKALTADEICRLYANATGQPSILSVLREGNIIADSKPLGASYDGANLGATWAASNTDAGTVPVTRDGVMEFAATEFDQITLPPNPDFDSRQGTIMFWMRSAGTAGSGDFGGMLVDRRSNRGDVIVQADDGSIFVQANDGGGTVNSFSTGAVSDDRWHHIAYVYDQAASGATTIYIDGVLSLSQAPARAWSWDLAQRIELGRSHDPYWKAYNGAMDDFRIYNRILDATEIALAAASGDLVDTAALTVRFNFDGPPMGITFTWGCGTLQCTDTLVGDGSGTVWTDLPVAPPYVVNPESAPARFYRIKF